MLSPAHQRLGSREDFRALAAHERATRLHTRVRHLEKRLSEALGEQAWHESGLGTPADIDTLHQLAGWLHQLTAIPDPDGGLLGWGVRDGKAMITTLQHLLIRVPGRVIHHAGQLILRLPPGHQLLTEVLTRLRALPAAS